MKPLGREVFQHALSEALEHAKLSKKNGLTSKLMTDRSLLSRGDWI